MKKRYNNKQHKFQVGDIIMTMSGNLFVVIPDVHDENTVGFTVSYVNESREFFQLVCKASERRDVK